jgi:hypothetical protein
MDLDQKHCFFLCKFAYLRFANWDHKGIFGFVICGLISTNLRIGDLWTSTRQKFANL